MSHLCCSCNLSFRLSWQWQTGCAVCCFLLLHTHTHTHTHIQKSDSILNFYSFKFLLLYSGSFSWVRITVRDPKLIHFGVGFRVLRFLKELVWFQKQSFLTRWEGRTGRIRCSVWPEPSACCYLRFVGMAANSWWCTRRVLVSSRKGRCCTSSLVVLPLLQVFLPL